jgi:hypothetical protein
MICLRGNQISEAFQCKIQCRPLRFLLFQDYYNKEMWKTGSLRVLARFIIYCLLSIGKVA